MLLPDPATAQSIGWLTLGLFGLVAGVNQTMTFFARLKSQPPGDVLERESADLRERLERIEEKAVTVDICAAAHQGVEHRLGRAEKNIGEIWNTLRTEISALRDHLDAWSKDTEHALGRIEGELRSLRKP